MPEREDDWPPLPRLIGSLDGDVSETPKLAPITHLTLYERVYEELRKAIMGGGFAPGEALTIRGVAQQLGTSSMPAREALRRLATEGAVEVLPNRTIRIPIMTKDRLAELRSIRLLLEGEAAQLAAVRVSAEERALIEILNTEFEALSRACEPNRMLAANQRFHFAVYSAAKTQTLLSLIGMLWLQAGPWLLQTLRRSLRDNVIQDYVGVSLGHHQDLLAALRDQSGTRAAEAVRADIRDAAAYFGATEFEEGGSAA